MSAQIADYTDESRIAIFLRQHGTTWLCGITGFLSAFTIPLVGQLPVGELILMVVAAWAVIRAIVLRGWAVRLQQLGWYKLLLALIVVMALGYVVSDLYRGTAWGNLVRGWARVGFLGVNLVAIPYLIGERWSRLWVYWLALFAGGAVNAALFGPLFGEWWQFGFGYLVTALAVFLVGGRAITIQVAVAAALGVLNLVLGARSLGGACLLASVLLLLPYARGIWRPVCVLASLGALIVLFQAADRVVDENQDHSGSNTERRSMVETAGELFISSPFIGQGSWFTASHLLARLEERRAFNDPTFRGYSEDEARQIAIHSQLLVALAEGGILGGAFFLGFGFFLLKTLRSLFLISVPRRLFALFIVILGLWNLLMSPFSGVARTEIVLAVCTCLLVVLQRSGELEEDFRE